MFNIQKFCIHDGDGIRTSGGGITVTGGCSDYFTNLTEDLQDNVIERTFAKV